ncbi:MAG: glycosyltransferase, partial [Pseudomonadales bacterium]|nr:glycosyltransferase [Pseudomonadales bacterium]
MSLRIAMVVDPWSLPFNGTVVSTRRFIFALAASGFRIRVLAIDADPAVDSAAFQRLSIPGFNRIINTMRAPLARPERSKLRAALQDCDVVHVQFPFFLGHAAIGEAKRMGIPVVCSFHVQPENILRNIGLPGGLLTTWLYRLFIAAIYNRSDLVIAPSPFAAQLLIDHGLRRPVEVV